MNTFLFVDHVIPGHERCCMVIRCSDDVERFWQRYLRRQEFARVCMGPEQEAIAL